MVYKNKGTSLNPDSLIHQRNTFTEQFIPGAVKGAYPIVAEKLGFPIINPITINGKQGYEMRGLWESVVINGGLFTVLHIPIKQEN